MALLQTVGVLVGVDGKRLVPPAVDVLQPQQEAVTHLMEVLRRQEPPQRVSELQLPEKAVSHLTLQQRLLQGGPPLIQGHSQLVPMLVQVFQPDLQLLGVLQVRLQEVGAAQVNGENDGLPLVVSLLQLLHTEEGLEPQQEPTGPPEEPPQKNLHKETSIGNSRGTSTNELPEEHPEEPPKEPPEEPPQEPPQKNLHKRTSI